MNVLVSILVTIVIVVAIARSYKIVFAAQIATNALIVNIVIVAVI